MAFKLATVKEPIYSVELPDGTTKEFPLWDFIQTIGNAEVEATKTDANADPLVASRDCLRKLLGYDALTTHQAVELKADAALQSRELEAVKKLLRAGQAK